MLSTTVTMMIENVTVCDSRGKNVTVCDSRGKMHKSWFNRCAKPVKRGSVRRKPW